MKTRFILLFISALSGINLASGAILQFTNSISSSTITGGPPVMIPIQQDQYGINPPIGYINHKVDNRIILAVDHAYPFYVANAYSYTFTIALTKFDINMIPTNEIITLDVEYNPNANPGVGYKDRSVYHFSDVHRIEFTVTQIIDKNTGAIIANPEDNITVTSVIEIERYFNLNTASTTCLALLGNNTNSDPAFDELDVQWAFIPGAEEYQLEWVYVDDYKEDGTAKLISAISWDFRNNSTRVTVSGSSTSYKISLVYERGYVICRIRGVGRNLSNPDFNVYGAWGMPDVGTNPGTTGCGDNFYVLAHRGGMNWQYSSSFAEEGKKKEIVSYFDGSSRNRQMVTGISTDNKAVVGESVYDYTGRKAIDVLPVPVQSPALDYNAGFNKNNLGFSYSWRDFDKDPGSNCITIADPLSTTSGASNYYSAANPDKTNEKANIPDAGNYPMVQTEYMPDNTGRVRRQGGLGPNHQLGNPSTDHSTKNYYGQPNQVELDRLFGSEVGNAVRYRKNMVVDPNGQISISYTDLAGQVIATALSGNVPANVKELASSQVTQSMSVDLFSKDASGISKQNSPNLEFDAIEFKTQFPVSSAGNYTFDYGVTPLEFTDACMGTEVCYDCNYKMEIFIIDDCRNVIYSSSAKIGSPTLDDECDHVIYFDPTLPFDPFVLDLSVGVYEIYKVLRIDEDAYQFYLGEYLSTKNSCFVPLATLITEEKEKLDYTGCDITCAECLEGLGTVDEFIVNGMGTEADWLKEYKECMEPCTGPSFCEATLHMMLADVSVGGQYAEYLNRKTGKREVSLYQLSLLNPENKLHITGITGEPWQNPEIPAHISFDGQLKFGYYETDGITLSIIPVSTNADGVKSPQASSYYVDPEGREFTYPQHLVSVHDFILYWKTSWARSLVKYHPEFCYFQWCKENLNTSFNEYEKTSEEFDYYLLTQLNTYSSAITAGFAMNGADIDDLLDADPYFKNSSPGFLNKPTFRNRLLYYWKEGSTDYNIMDVAAMTARCGSFTGTKANLPSGVNCTSFLSTGDSALETKIWIAYRSLYLSIKQKILKEIADADILAGSCQNYNGCIGEKQFNPIVTNMFSGISSLLTFINDNITEPCGLWTYHLYMNKTRRFDLGSEVVELDKNKADYNRAYYGRACPLDLDLMTLINEELSKGTYNTNHDLYSYNAFTPEIEKALLGFLTPTSGDKGWKWDGTGSTSTILKVKFYSIQDAVPVQCSTATPYNFEITLLSGSWSASTVLKDIKFTGIDASTGLATFIFLDGATIVATGKSCLPMGSCPFLDFCKTTDYANSLANLMAALAFDGKLFNSAVNLEATAFKPFITRFIRNNIAAPNTSLSWTSVSSSSFKIHETGNTANAITISITGGVTSGTTHFGNIRTDKNDVDNGFYIDGYTISGVNTYHGSIDVGVMGKCEDPVPMTCEHPHYEVTKDFEELLKSLIESKPTGNTNLTSNNLYTALLESYIGRGNVTYLQPSIYRDSIKSKIEVRDPSTNALLNTCEIKLFRRAPATYERPVNDLIEIGVLMPDMEKSTFGGTCDFTIIAKYLDGTFEELDGYISCLPLYSCKPCRAPIYVEGGNDTCTEYFIYKQQMEMYNYTPLPYNKDFPCACVKNYLFYIRVAQVNQDPLVSLPIPRTLYQTIPPIVNSNGSRLNPPIDIQQFNDPQNYDCLIDIDGECGLTLGENLVNDQVSFYNLNIRPPTYPTLPSLPPTTTPPPPNSTCICLLKYAIYLERWTDLYVLVNRPAMNSKMSSLKPVTFDEFARGGCDAYDCFDQYQFYVQQCSIETATPVAYDATVDCNCWLRFTKGFPNLKDPHTAQDIKNWCKTNGRVIYPGKYDHINFFDAPEIRHKGLETAENLQRPFNECDDDLEYMAIAEPPNPCEEWLDRLAEGNARIRFDDQIRNLTKEFQNAYYSKCMQAIETFTVNYTSRDYHFTLYYYDQAGNLARTVPPQGVHLVTSSGDLTQINSDRTRKQKIFFTSHELSTVYEYNSLNQLQRQSVPDHAKMNRWSVSNTTGFQVGFAPTDMVYTSPTIGYTVGNYNSETHVYKTTDAGKNWTRTNPIQSTDLIGLEMANSSVGYAIGAGGLFLRTGDGGSNWKIVSTSKDFTGDILDIAVVPNGASPIEGYIVGKAGLSRDFSDNAGVITFGSTNKALPTAMSGKDILSVSFKTSTLGLAVVDYNGLATVVKTTVLASGTPWTDHQIETKTRATHLNEAFVLDASNAFAVGDDGTLLKTTNGGQYWETKAGGVNYNFIDVHFHSTTTSDGFCLADNGNLYQTGNGGTSWAQFTSGATYKSFHMYSNTSGYAVGSNGLIAKIYYDVNQFRIARIYPALVPNGSFTSVYFISANDGLIGTSDGKVYLVSNAGLGLSFKNISPTGVGSGKNFTRIYMNATSMGAVLAATGELYKIAIASGVGTYTDISGGNSYKDFSIATHSSTVKILALSATTDVIYEFVASNPTSPTNYLSYTSGTADGVMRGISSNATVNTAYLLGKYGTINQITVSTKAESNLSAKTRPPFLKNVELSKGSNKRFWLSGTDGTALYSDNDGDLFYTLATSVNSELNQLDLFDKDKGMAGGKVGALLKIETLSNPDSKPLVVKDIAVTSITSGVATDINAVVSLTASTAYFASDGKIYATTNGGTSWTATDPNGADPRKVLALTESGGAVFASGEAGYAAKIVSSTWTNAYLTCSKVYDIHFEGQKGMMVGEHGVNLYSTDGGKTWLMNKAIINGSSYATLNKVAIYEGSASVVGQAGYASSMNPDGSGVSSFSQSGSDNYKSVAFNAAGYKILLTETHIYTKPSGGSWGAAISLNGSPVCIDATISGNKVIVVGSGGFVKVSGNITTGSFSVPTTLPSVSGKLHKVVMYDMFRAYIVGDNGVILKTTIQGIDEWEQRASEPAGTYATDTIFALAISSRSNISFAGRTNTPSPHQYSTNVDDQADFASSLFWYDKLGRLVVSQNTKQFNKTTKAYSYTRFDAIGRIVQVGEKANNTEIETTYSGPQIDDGLLTTWVNSGIPATKTEVTSTFYDNAFAAGSAMIQNNLRVRVASITYEAVNDDVILTYDYATHYSYDIHGNVDHMANEVPALGTYGYDYTHIYYKYDLISGNVNQVDYSPGQKDEFHHMYEYDADNRITDVYTSTDGKVWDNDARYMYYGHGPLARRELGDIGVQGADYAYSIQGWMKGVNSNTMDYTRDMGRDGDHLLGGNLHNKIARDAFGFTLGYYTGDFTAIDNKPVAQRFEADYAGSDMVLHRDNLWNGNISHMVTVIPNTANYSGGYVINPDVRGNAYKYDQLNRISQMRSFDNINMGTNVWQSGYTDDVFPDGSPKEYATNYEYDANGNITSLFRNGVDPAGPSNCNLMDDLVYHYELDGVTGNIKNNRLLYVTDNVTAATIYNNDIETQASTNYDYDELGNLIKDEAEEIGQITWTVSGKIKSITRSSGTKPNLEFEYDAAGNRILKKELPNNSDPVKITYYQRDASGNVMATYSIVGAEFTWEEIMIYGNKREGLIKKGTLLNPEPCEIEFNAENFFNGSDIHNQLMVALTQLNLMPQFPNIHMQLVNLINQINPQITDFGIYQIYIERLKEFLCLFKCYPNISVVDFTTHIEPLFNTIMMNASNGGIINFNDPNSVNFFWDGAIEDMRNMLEINLGKCLGDELKVTMRGLKFFELTNHLGNVLAVVTDHKVPVASGGAGANIDYYEPEISSITDYDPFGMQILERAWTASSYRYGFQDQEKDDEIKGTGNSINYKYRMDDSRLGRFFSVDPLSPKYPFNSTYAFSENRVIDAIELEGLEAWEIKNEWNDDYKSKYNEFVDHQANEYNKAGVDRTCEDFALSTLIDFASQNNLPVTISNGTGSYNADSKDFKDVESYKNQVLKTTGARDLQNSNNTTQVIEGDQAISNAQAGDLLLKRNSDDIAVHVQVVSSTTESTVNIRQGNTGSFGSSDPESQFYQGVPVQSGSYDKKTGSYTRGGDVTVNASKSFNLERRQWNYGAFNFIQKTN